MHFPRVHWSEGMFLVPQHFQAADAHWDETVRQRGQWDLPYFYGVHRIEISQTALESKRFQLNACEARLRDGTSVTYGAGMGPGAPSDTVGAAAAALPAIGLEEAFARSDVARVYLAIPSQRAGQNAESSGAAERFRVSSRPLLDDVGDTEEEVEFRDLNARLIAIPHDPAMPLEPPQLQGYDLLQVAQVKRTGEKRPTPELNENYFPPVLAIDAWPPLGRELILGLFDRIGASWKSCRPTSLSVGSASIRSTPATCSGCFASRACTKRTRRSTCFATLVASTPSWPTTRCAAHWGNFRSFIPI